MAKATETIPTASPRKSGLARTVAGLGADALLVLDLLPVGPASRYGLSADEVASELWPGLTVGGSRMKAVRALEELQAALPGVVIQGHGHGLAEERNIRQCYSVSGCSARRLWPLRRERAIPEMAVGHD